MTITSKTARRAGFAVVAAMLFASAPALGEANEYFNCTLDEDAKTEDLVKLGKDFTALLEANGQTGVRIAFLFPLYSADISRGSFFWQATAANFAGLGAMNDFWDTDASADIRKRWTKLTSNCKTSSAYAVVRAE